MNNETETKELHEVDANIKNRLHQLRINNMNRYLIFGVKEFESLKKSRMGVPMHEYAIFDMQFYFWIVFYKKDLSPQDACILGKYSMFYHI